MIQKGKQVCWADRLSRNAFQTMREAVRLKKIKWINQITSGVLLTKRHRLRLTLSVISGHPHKRLNHGNFCIVATDATVLRRTRFQKSPVRSIILSKRGRKQLMNCSYHGYLLCLIYSWVILQRTPTPRNNTHFFHTEQTTVKIHRSSNQRHEQKYFAVEGKKNGFQVLKCVGQWGKISVCMKQKHHIMESAWMIFIHSLRCIQKLVRSLRSLDFFFFMHHNSPIKIVRVHFP